MYLTFKRDGLLLFILIIISVSPKGWYHRHGTLPPFILMFMLKCTVLQHWLNIVDQMSCTTDAATPPLIFIMGETQYTVCCFPMHVFGRTFTVYSNMMDNTVKLHFNMICSLRMSIKLWMLQCLGDNNIIHNVSMLQLRGSGGNTTTRTSWLHKSWVNSSSGYEVKYLSCLTMDSGDKW